MRFRSIVGVRRPRCVHSSRFAIAIINPMCVVDFMTVTTTRRMQCDKAATSWVTALRDLDEETLESSRGELMMCHIVKVDMS